MCCDDPPPPPDLSGMASASEEVARIQQQTAADQLDWAKEQDTMNRATLERVLGVQLPAMEDQASWAREDRGRYKSLFQPLEDQFVEEAKNYDNPQHREEAIAKATSGVSQQFDAQRKNALQRLEGYGVDPSQTRNAALDVAVRTNQAAAMAQAGSAAENRVEDVGRAMRGDSINMGRGMASQATQGYAGANQSGNSAVGNSNSTTSTSTSALTSGYGASGQALQGYGQSANIMNSGYQNEMAGYNAKNAQTAGTMSAIGGMAGMFAMADGGALPFDEEGPVPEMGMGDGSGIDDTVPAKLSEGEYVIPADVVRAKGMEFFDKLVERYHTPADEQRRAA